MIPNQWYVVLESREVRDTPVGVTRLGEKLVFWRDSAGKLSCLSDLCVHRGALLSRGQISHDRLLCPFHGFEYDPSGRITAIPANGTNAPVPAIFKTHSYPVYEAHDFIWIWWGHHPPADLTPPRFFADIDSRYSYAGAADPWQTHYSRAIENQLDVVHLPFVHDNSIGRGNRTLVDGPAVRWIDDDMFFVYVRNRVDDGRPPRKPNHIAIDPEPSFKLEFIFPNLWENHLGDSACIVLAFVPVDNEHTIQYLRFYQRFMRTPGLRSIVNRLAMPMNLYILHQDRAVVETQQPKRSALRIGERLIHGDFPIIEYRRRRQELMEQSWAAPLAANEVPALTGG